MVSVLNKSCQFFKRNKKKVQKLPHEDAESKPGNVLCVDLMQQYQVNIKIRCKKYQMITRNKTPALCRCKSQPSITSLVH